MYNFTIWIFSALILRMLGADESGTYAIASSIGNTLYAASLFGMRTFIVSDSDHQYSCDEYMYARILAIVGTFVFLCGMLFFFQYNVHQKIAIVAYTLFKLTEAAIEVLDCFCQREKQMQVNAISMMIRSIVYAVVFGLCLYFLQSMNLGFFLLSIVSIFILLFYNFPRVKKLTDLSMSQRFNKNSFIILRQCFPLMIFEMLSSFIVAYPRVAYDQVGSHASLGIYASIYTMVIFMQLICNVFIYTFAPYMADSYNQGRKKQFYQYVLMLCGGTIILGLLAEVLTYLLGRPVIGMVYGSDVSAYYTYLYLGIISGISLAFTWIASQISVILSHRDDQLISSMVAAITCVVLSKIMIQTDCNSISIVLMLSNVAFLLTQLCLVRFGKGSKK